ncbi:uncharacterized protein LOC111014377 [Momordica charantia]|uniref:Uncharacterized protein LOC111014377 n=1 Tax=Momordica charantia TaxID=3673 RepID=A0A6J1CUM2_MOMCH|nr:uncharacterized protein LOC111014377 [Momordica charantia]
MASGELPVQIEEQDDELFEIDLEAVNSIVPPPHCSDSAYTFFTAGAALLANCLLPIADVSNAVPMADSEPTRLEKLLLLPPGFGILALIDRSEMKINRG